MAYYLVRVAYRPEIWADLLHNSHGWADEIRPAVEQLGGSIVGAWGAFGGHDVVAIMQIPNNVRAAALSMAFSASGAISAVETIPLIAWEEGMEAMRRANRLVAHTEPAGMEV